MDLQLPCLALRFLMSSDAPLVLPYVRQSLRFSHRLVSVVLRTPHTGLGTKGQRVKVRPGFARNFLVPRHLAAYATKENIKRFESSSTEEEEEETEENRKAEDAIRDEREIVFTRAVVGSEPEGPLRSCVDGKMIRKALRETFGIHVPPERIDLDRPIWSTGLTKVPVRMGKEPSMIISVRVKGLSD